MALATPALAKTETMKGTSCWTGKLDVVSTTAKDMGWAYSLNYVWLSDDNDPKKSVTGRCVGSGGLINGKYQSAPFFCDTITADGSKYMGSGIGTPEKLDAVLFGGTGKFKGVSGTVKGGPQISLGAPQGEFASCRPQTLERVTPD